MNAAWMWIRMAVGSVRHRVRLHLQSTTIQGDSKLADTMNRSLNGHNPSLANIPYLHWSIRTYSYMPVCVLWGETNTKTYVIYMWASLSPFRSTWRVNCHGARDGVCVLELHLGYLSTQPSHWTHYTWIKRSRVPCTDFPATIILVKIRECHVRTALKL